MKLEEVVVDAIAQALLKQFDKLSRPSVVAVMSMPATAVGHEFKKALRDELKKRRRTAKGRRLKSA